MPTNTDFIIGCLPNYMRDPAGVTLTAASRATAALDEANLLTPDINALWRSDGLRLLEHTTLEWLLPRNRTCHCFSLVNCNLSRLGEYRVVLSGTTTVPAPLVATNPDGTITTTGTVTGARTDVDEGFAAVNDSDLLAVSASSSFRLDFPSPGSLEVGDRRQTFRIRIRRSSGNPTLRVDLYEGGSTVTTLVNGWVIPTDGVWYDLEFPWTASDLADPTTPTDVQLFVSNTQSSASQFQVSVVDWVYELTGGSFLYDTSWQRLITPPTAFGDENLLRYLEEQGDGGVLSGMQCIPIFFLNDGAVIPLSVRSGRVYFRDSLVDDTYLAGGPNATGYLQAGHIAIGPTSPLDFVGQPQYVLQVEDSSSVVESIGGVEYIDVGSVRRALAITLHVPFEDGLFDYYDTLFRKVYTRHNFLVGILPGDGDSISYDHARTFWGRMVPGEESSITHLPQYEGSEQLQPKWVITRTFREIL